MRSDEKHPTWQRWLYRLVERAYLRTVDGLICDSEATRLSATRLAGSQPPGIVAWPGRASVPAPLSAAEITARAQASGPLRLLFVGNLIRRKGLHILLETLAHVPQESWRLAVVGSPVADPSYATAVRRQSRRLGIDPGIESARETVRCRTQPATQGQPRPGRACPA